jgi:acyl-CoA synthetase (AMP-forming)/AMP-acid ligase II
LTETTAVGANAAGVEHLQIDGSVGLLAPNTMAKIVDIDSKKALPPGQHGEIWLRGPSIMQGKTKIHPLHLNTRFEAKMNFMIEVF